MNNKIKNVVDYDYIKNIQITHLSQRTAHFMQNTHLIIGPKYESVRHRVVVRILP